MGFGFTDTGDLAIWYVDEQRALHVQVEGSDCTSLELADIRGILIASRPGTARKSLFLAPID